jgi:hypothetical protein
MLDGVILTLQSNLQGVSEARSAPNVWSDAGWVSVIVALVFGLATVSLALIAIRQARRRKELTYEILSTTPLATLHEDMEGRIQIVFDGQPIRDVQLVLLKIKNSGNLPILSSDYEDPLRLRVNKSAKILSVGVVDTFPQSLNEKAKDSVEFNSERVKVKPILLNGSDYIKVKILITQLTEPVAVSGRIAGVSDIKELKPGTNYPYEKILARLVQGIILFLIWITLAFSLPWLIRWTGL